MNQHNNHTQFLQEEDTPFCNRDYHENEIRLGQCICSEESHPLGCLCSPFQVVDCACSSFVDKNPNCICTNNLHPQQCICDEYGQTPFNLTTCQSTKICTGGSFDNPTSTNCTPTDCTSSNQKFACICTDEYKPKGCTLKSGSQQEDEIKQEEIIDQKPDPKSDPKFPLWIIILIVVLAVFVIIIFLFIICFIFWKWRFSNSRRIKSIKEDFERLKSDIQKEQSRKGLIEYNGSQSQCNIMLVTKSSKKLYRKLNWPSKSYC
ncbi:MAG: hypothetical protein EZS28_037037 [Streblomastix strix]|uniref:Uncharacterized protein n=1 Tax=Streblomastix strix TaxID=222440 RepID=A0A5J4U954_9EUKA|nr:MAG: hypothetical protein EZS28_037037 [Streblomastix strix]